MESVLSKDIQAALDAVRLATRKTSSRLRLDVRGRTYPILRMWKSGFAVHAEDAPHLRGRVDLFEGSTHLFQCLIVASEEAQGEMQYEFKRATPVAKAAALDFEKAVGAPVALIESDFR